QAEEGIRDDLVTGVQTCALPISFQDVTAELREDLGDLAQEVVAVGAGERSQVLPVPAPVPVVPGRRAVGQRRYFGTEARVQEEQIGRASCRERGELSTAEKEIRG